jgi:hypothetical protein
MASPIFLPFQPSGNGVVGQLGMILNYGRIDGRLENGSVDTDQHLSDHASRFTFSFNELGSVDRRSGSIEKVMMPV